MKSNKQFYLSLMCTILFVVVWYTLYKAYSFLLAPVINTYVGVFWGTILSSMVVPYAIVLPVTYPIIKWIPVSTDKEQKSYPMKNFIKAFFIQSGFSMLILFLVNQVLTATGYTPTNTFSTQVSENLFFYIFLTIIFTPIVEEFFFRKLVLSRLMDYGKWKAILISACLFAVPHVISQGIPQMFYTFILGIVWAYVTIKTKRLRYAIILHSISNLWGMFLPMVMMKSHITMLIYLLVWIAIVPVTAIVLVIKNKKEIF